MATSAIRAVRHNSCQCGRPAIGASQWLPVRGLREDAIVYHFKLMQRAACKYGLRVCLTVMTLVAAGWSAAPAMAGWRASNVTAASIAYNQGVSFDSAHDNFFFDGVSSVTNSGLYRTNSKLVQTAANLAVLPPTHEGYNHAGDLSFDPVGRRVLLPLECYYPTSGGNTCGVGAIGVADPVSLRFLYYVNLDTAQIQKAMWDEISPDGRWIWTSSGTHLLVYRAAAINSWMAERQRAGTSGGLTGKDLGSVLPTSGVTGATFYQDVTTRGPRLLLALNRDTYSEVISYATGTARDGSPTLVGGPRSEITVPRSSSNNESEGLAVTGAGRADNPLGGVLDWQMLPVITASSLYSRILSYLPSPAPPRDSANIRRGQRLRAALSRGLRLNVVCNSRCTNTAVATIAGKLARRLGLTRGNARRYTIGSGKLGAGSGRRTLVISFGPRARAALATLRSVTIAVVVQSSDPFSRSHATYKTSATLSR
jgi:hypothetical protein